MLYDVTYEVVTEIMELIDGYSGYSDNNPKDIERLKEEVERYITFISPEYYPQTLGVGDILEFYEGSKLVGNIQIIEIYNELLKRTCE